MSPNPQNQMTNDAANQAARAILLKTAVPELTPIPTQSGTIGGQIRLKLPNTGIGLGVWLEISGTITFSGGTATRSPNDIYALLNRVTYIGFDNINRHNVSGPQLHEFLSLRAGFPWGLNNQASSSILTNPNVPTTGTNAAFSFFIYVPIAYDYKRGDLRGAVYAQTAGGEHFVVLDIASALTADGDDTYVYNNGGTVSVTLTSLNIQATYESLNPQMPPGYPSNTLILPAMDLATAFYLEGNSSNDNLAPGMWKDVEIPNMRLVEMLGLRYTYNGVLGGGSYTNDLQKFQLVSNGNHFQRQWDRKLALMQMRERLNGDIGRSGVYLWDLRNNPIATYLYGQMSMQTQPGTSPTGVTKLEKWIASFSVQGSALPGMGNR